MLSQRSIKRQYTWQVSLSVIALLSIFSFAIYEYIRSSLYADVRDSVAKKIDYLLEKNVSNLFKNDSDGLFSLYVYDLGGISNGETKIEFVATDKIQNNITEPQTYNALTQINTRQQNKKVTYIEFLEGGYYYFRTIYPYTDSYSLIITKDITAIHRVLDLIFKSILVIDFVGLIFIQVYALLFSSVLFKPILELSNRIRSLNESALKSIAKKDLPKEFNLLIDSINGFIARVASYLQGQKELFIGIAHELKTPLAVLKTKSEVTLLKPRDNKQYIEALRANIQSVNDMNLIIKTLLDIGRAESAQFEKTSRIDVIAILQKIASDFSLLAQKENKDFDYYLLPKQLIVPIKSTLLTQIVQNFLQNAFKFTPQGKRVTLKSQLIGMNVLEIAVLDEGCGISGSIQDVYAPFNRAGDKSGVGLGLFLAKMAATAMGARIEIKNRTDMQGCLAVLELYFES